MAKGFNDTRDLVTTTDGVPFIRLQDDIAVALADYNRNSGFLRSNLTLTVTEEKIKEGLTQNQMQFQRATEYGRPDRQRITQAEVERFIPIEDFSLGVGFTRKYLALATASQVALQVDEATRADQELIIRSILQQIFRIENLGAGGIYKAFWNNDGQVPPRFADTTFLGTHTHYLTSAALDLAAVTALKLKLTEHGYDTSRELWINVAQEAAVRAITGFVPIQDRDLRLIANTNPINATNIPFALVDPTQFIGALLGFRVRVYSWVPAGYVFAYDAANTGLRKSLAWREYPVASLRGLQLFNEDPGSSFPLVNSFFARNFGLCALDRSNGALLQVTGGGYTTPTILSI
jgi:hypothetical protein